MLIAFGVEASEAITGLIFLSVGLAAGLAAALGAAALPWD
jgi:hypothetical protein